MDTVNRYVALRQIPTPLRYSALLQLLPLAQVHHPPMVPRVEEAIAHDKRVLGMDAAWRGLTRNQHAEGASELDQQLDRALTRFRNLLNVAHEGPVAPASDAAATLLGHVFPTGKASEITSQKYAAQHATVAVRFEALRAGGDLAGAVAAVSGAAAYVEEIAALNEAYGAMLNPAATAPTTEELLDARREGQDQLARIVAVILGAFPDPAQAATRDALLAPIVAQDDAMAEAHKRGPAAPATPTA